ncbi:MAG: hypothetical protein HY619_06115 [Thaumarchaeota archaeon]|nr:hypothetical protein [Nitrososphaerota archaeon]
MDSSLLIEADYKGVLNRLASSLSREGQRTVAPPKVYEETVTDARRIGFVESAARINQLFSSQTIVIENPSYLVSKVSKTVDAVRNCIAKKAGKPVHKVERADLQIVALAVMHSRGGDEVELIFRDAALKDCLKAVLKGKGIPNVVVTDSSSLVQRLRSGR